MDLVTRLCSGQSDGRCLRYPESTAAEARATSVATAMNNAKLVNGGVMEAMIAGSRNPEYVTA
jgi:hypothetical protein